MTDHTPKLTERDVLAQARERLQPNLRFKADGSVCNQEQLIHMLLGIAATMNTLEAVCVPNWKRVPVRRPSEAI